MPATLTNLTPVENLALHKVDLSKSRREQIRPGTYSVNLVVHLQGSVTVGEEYEQEFPATVPWKDLFLASLSVMDSDTREAFVADFLEASQSGPVEVNPEIIADEVRGLADEIVGTSVRTCKGKTTCALEVEAVQQAVVVAAPQEVLV